MIAFANAASTHLHALSPYSAEIAASQSSEDVLVSEHMVEEEV